MKKNIVRLLTEKVSTTELQLGTKLVEHLHLYNEVAEQNQIVLLYFYLFLYNPLRSRFLKSDFGACTIVCSRPTVLMIVGVNGGGKTTTIGKLIYVLSSSNCRNPPDNHVRNDETQTCVF